MSARKVEAQHLVAGGGDPGRGEISLDSRPAGVNAPGYNNRQPMNPAEIEVHIEELVLHGFDPSARWQIGDAVGHELRALLGASGIPPRWLSAPERLDAGTIATTSLSRPVTIGAQIAAAAYRGDAK